MRLLILFSFLGAAAFAAPNAASKFGDNRIVGGSDADIKNYPYMSNMLMSINGIIWSPSCGGSLMTPTTILSAAHCYYLARPTHFRVRLGSSYAWTGGTVHLVSELLLHENFVFETLDNDVAIIRIATPANPSDSVGFARIAGPNYQLPDGTDLTAIGWGSLQSDSIFQYPRILQHVVLNQINQEVCAERYAYLKAQPGFEDTQDVTPGMLCAGILDVGGKDACQRDSGGPLAHDGDVIVGVISWGYGCAHEFFPGVFARVSYFSDWILQNGSG